MEGKTFCRSVIYTDRTIDYLFFSSACSANILPNRLILSLLSENKRMVIKGDDFILQKIYDNLCYGVEESVLMKLLDFCAVPNSFEKLKEGHYIE